MLQYMQCNVDRCNPSKGETYKLAKEFGQQLIHNTCEVICKSPVYKDSKCRTVLARMKCLNFSSSDVSNHHPNTEVIDEGESIF